MNETKKPEKSTVDKAIVDWERTELDYRAGVKTLRQIADEYGISEGSIRKRAKREGWTRDLSIRIQAKAEELVRKEAVRKVVRKEQSAYHEREVVEANGQAVADVILGHRKDIRRTMLLVLDMTSNMEKLIKPECQEMLDQLGVLMCKPDDRGVDKLNELYNYIISLPNLVKMTKSLAETLRILIDAQRKAFGIDDKYNPNDDAGGGLGFHAGRNLSHAERAVRLTQLLGQQQKASQNG